MHDDEHTHTYVVLTKGTMVQHYRIVEKIGAGGMGEVYLAEDTKLDRRVALKFLSEEYLNHQEMKTRFLREAKAAAGLSHPNIVTVYEVGEHHGKPFFSMEHVGGQSLHHFAHDEQLPIKRVIELAIQIGDGLSEAHSMGIVHRDIKTANIVIDRKGLPRILDFGLAKVGSDDALTKTGSTFGTVAYMSPEQVEGNPADERSDLYSFGIVLYELLTGRTPFKRDNYAATLKAISTDTAEPLIRYKSDISYELQQIVSKLLERDPQHRYQTASDVVSDLRRMKAEVASARLSISSGVAPPFSPAAGLGPPRMKFEWKPITLSG